MAQIKDIVIPDIGTTSEVTVIEVSVKPGDKIQVDQPLITLESEKASMEIPASEAGIVESVEVKIGSKVTTGAVILKLKNSEAEQKKADIATQPSAARKDDTGTKAAASSAPNENKHETTTDVSRPRNENQNVYASPGVRRLARELDIDLAKIKGTGRKDRLQKEDLLNYIKNTMQKGGGGSGLPVAPEVDFTKFGDVEAKPLSKIKKYTAQNLHRNWLLIPHVTQFDEADITDLEAFRKAQQSNVEQGVKLTPLTFIMKAVVATLKNFPQFNASLDAKGENLILKKYFHVGVAVDTPEGLVVPVIRDVDKKSIVQLAKELAEVSNKARNKQLMPADMQGSSFTLSSLGGIGGTAFTPIVNLPDVAILGVSKSQMKLIHHEGEFVPRLMLPLSLSYDHRVIDGAEGARFIVQLGKYLTDIRMVLM